MTHEYAIGEEVRHRAEAGIPSARKITFFIVSLVTRTTKSGTTLSYGVRQLVDGAPSHLRMELDEMEIQRVRP